MVHNYNNVNIHSDDYPTINDLEERFGIKLEKTKILKVDLPSANTLTSHYKNKRYVEDVTKDYDLFINFMFLSKHVGKAKRNIYLCMFPPQKYSFSKFSQKLIGSALDLQFKKSYDYFITNSLFTNHWQQHYWNTGKKNKPIYPPVFSENEMIKVDLSEKKNVILSVGRFFVGAHNKKQDILVDFYIANHTMFEGWELHLVGAVSNNPNDLDYVNSIKNKIKDYPIYLHINIPLVEVNELYTKAKLFWHATGLDEESDMFPDKMEHFGITTVEAMSNGVVPIVINKGGQTEIVNHQKDGFLWNTREELLEYTLELTSDSNKRERIALQAIERAGFFSVENFYKQNEEIFNAL
jgi:glycosyltransferase involved in cell wall biosynthesis